MGGYIRDAGVTTALPVHLVCIFFPSTDVLEAVIFKSGSLLVVPLPSDQVLDHFLVSCRAPWPAPNCCKHLCAAVVVRYGHHSLH